MSTYSPLPYYVLADLSSGKRRVIGYRVCFMPKDQPGTHVEVEDGYFPIRGRIWLPALTAANKLRDELNVSPSGDEATHPTWRE